MSYRSRFSTTHWRAAMTWETDAAPSRPESLTLSSPAAGATPFRSPLPAMRPAMNVPCPYESAQPGSVEKLTHEVVVPPAPTIGTRLSARSGTSAMPVSMTATVTPAPCGVPGSVGALTTLR